LPDVTILPKIAALYCVTIDDLYKETSVVYENYASRLLSVFEASHKPEDFMQAETEYRKMLKTGEYTTNDLRSYGILHQYMMQVCRAKAEEFFNRVIRKGPAEDPETYWSTRRQKGYFLWELGRNQENIDAILPLVEAGSNELQEWICLIQAYSFAENYDTAWEWVKEAESRFPESAILHIYAGDLLRSMKRYDEAFRHWKRALEMEPEWCDSAYSMASCYEEMGDWANAYAVYTQIADNLESRGFEAEVNWPRTMALKCQEKMRT
jgi:tetratricopeptide (TPR) repeat protein